MKKKHNKKIIIVMLITSAIILLFGILWFGVLKNAILSYHGPFPAYSVVTMTSSLSCGTGAYDKQFLPYQKKSNVKLLYSDAEFRSLDDNDNFNFYIFDVNGKSPRGTMTYDSVIQPDGSVTPNIKCDGTKDCLFGYTVETWELKSDGLCYVKQAPIESPTIPLPSGFQLWLSLIIDWFKSLFAEKTVSIMPVIQHTILGQQDVEPNTQQTYNIELTATVPDNDYTDGSYQVQYGGWALLDKNGAIKQEGTWDKINGTYTKAITITTPTTVGDYMVVGMITQFDMIYNYTTKAWATSEEKIITKEAINLKNKYVVVAPTNPTSGGFSRFIASIINWFKNLFGFR